MFKTLALILIYSAFFIPAAPAAAKPEYQAEFSSSKINMDEPVEFRLLVTWPREEGPHSFALPVLPLKNLILERQGESQETYREGGKDWTQKSVTAIFRPLQKGEGAVEDFILPYVNTLTQEKGELLISTPRIKITAAPLKINPVWGFGAFGALLIFAAGWFLAQKRREAALKKAVAVRTPEELAVEKILSSLRAEDFIRKDRKEKLHQISAEFRIFLPAVYQMNASRPTDREILEELKTRELPAEEWKIVERLLKKLDEAKFTGQSLSDSDLDGIRKEIEAFAEGKRFSNSSMSSSPA